MSWVIYFFVALLAAVVGLFAVGFLANACVSWFRISSREGQSGYFVIMLALLGAIGGFLLSLMTTSLVEDHWGGAGFLKALGASLAVVLTLVALIAIVCRMSADIPPEIDGRSVTLEVELRLPEGHDDVRTIDRTKATFELLSVQSGVARNRRTGKLEFDAVKTIDGRTVIPAEVDLFTRSGQRVITVTFDGRENQGFLVALPARPTKKFEAWSPWLPHADGPNPWPSTKMSYRFRIRINVPPPEVPSERDLEAAALSALDPSAPLADWLAFLGDRSPMDQVNRVMEIVESRRSELPALILGDDPPRSQALFAVRVLREPTPEIRAAVWAEARSIERGIVEWNATASDDPRFLDAQFELVERFTHWKYAYWRYLRDPGNRDLSPLHAIHDAAKVRSGGMKIDEIVVAARAILEFVETSP